MRKTTLDIAYEDFGKYTVVSLFGKIRQYDFARINSIITIIKKNGTQCLVFNIENLTNIDSLSISVMVRVSRLIEKFCVYGLSIHNEEIFYRLGLQHIFKIYKTKNDFMFDRNNLGLL